MQFSEVDSAIISTIFHTFDSKTELPELFKINKFKNLIVEIAFQIQSPYNSQLSNTELH